MSQVDSSNTERYIPPIKQQTLKKSHASLNQWRGIGILTCCVLENVMANGFYH